MNKARNKLIINLNFFQYCKKPPESSFKQINSAYYLISKSANYFAFRDIIKIFSELFFIKLDLNIIEKNILNVPQKYYDQDSNKVDLRLKNASNVLRVSLSFKNYPDVLRAFLEFPSHPDVLRAFLEFQYYPDVLGAFLKIKYYPDVLRAFLEF